MVEILAGFLAFLIVLGMFASPIVILVLVIKKIKNRKPKSKTTIQQNAVSPKVTPQQFQNTIQQKEDIDEYYQYQYMPYRPRYFLTKNELYFYKELKKIAEGNNLVVLSKIRVADLVEVEPMDKKQWQIYFNKISKKHVDFALANPQNLQIELLIELDDYSHNDKQYERDRFIEAVYKKTGYKLLRVKNTMNLQENIEGALQSL